MWEPSNAIEMVKPTKSVVAWIVPPLASFTTAPRPPTQMEAPSYTRLHAPATAANVPCNEPSLALSLLTVPSPEFATQMLAPSNAIPFGVLPTGQVPCKTPSLALSLVTVPSPEFATQILAPSNATPCGAWPTEKLVSEPSAFSSVTTPV